MLRGKVFSRATAIMGIVGSSTLIIYLVLTTFVPDTAGIAMMIAAPGGLAALAWMAMYTAKLFRLSRDS